MNELKPLSHGNILIVGIKPSNLDEEIKANPRVIMWDSQHEHWTSKEIPSNVQAIFFTRWVGHSAFNRIHTEARKKHITLFNPEGTGMIAKQVKELLNMTKPVETVVTPQEKKVEVKKTTGTAPKLHVLTPFIDLNNNNVWNARMLMTKASEMGITSTEASLANFVGIYRRKTTGNGLKNTHPVTTTTKTDTGLDVSVQLLDDAIQSLRDMREFLIQTVEENRTLRQKVDRFRKVFDE